MQTLLTKISCLKSNVPPVVCSEKNTAQEKNMIQSCKQFCHLVYQTFLSYFHLVGPCENEL